MNSGLVWGGYDKICYPNVISVGYIVFN
jgi:hypothetical protein